MASIHKNKTGGQNWYCAFYDPEGYRRLCSTGTTDAKVARTICVNIERASLLARQGKLSNEKGMKLIRETQAAVAETHGPIAAARAHDALKERVEEFIKIAGGELTSYTIKSWLDSWITNRTDATKATVTTYQGVLDLFTKYLGARANRPLTLLRSKEVEDFKAKLVERVAPSTVNRAIKVLKASFNRAVETRNLEFNPAEHVDFVATEEGNRRPFTAEELKKLLAAAEGKSEPDPERRKQKAEWRTMILLGFYTGLRLNDCASLTWRNVQLHTGWISVTTQKTGRAQMLPIADPLARHLATLAGDDPDAPLCPSLCGKKSAWLSAQFYDLMVDAGLVEERDHQGKGKGRDSRREKNPISFHSLRYNNTSALKSAGVSDAVAMDLVGHETKAFSRNYTVIADSVKQDAVKKLPDIT